MWAKVMDIIDTSVPSTPIWWRFDIPNQYISLIMTIVTMKLLGSFYHYHTKKLHSLLFFLSPYLFSFSSPSSFFSIGARC